MAKESPTPIDVTTPDDEGAQSGGPSLFAKLKVLLFVVVVIAAECTLAWLYLPSAADSAAMAGAAGEDETPAEEEKTEDESEDAVPDWVEVDLGMFSCGKLQPAAGANMRVDFNLWGMVEQADYDNFLGLWEAHERRIRDQVYYTVRSADVNDLTDPRLALLKRKTVERTNKIIGQPLVKAVVFDDFSMIEQ